MKKTVASTEEAKQLLSPIKNRTDLEPDREFVNQLQHRLQMKETKKNWRVKAFPLLTAAAVLLLLPLLVSSFVHQREAGKPFQIEEFSQIQLVDTIEYGKADLRNEWMNPVSSFDIEKNTLYVLDDANSRIVIRKKDGKTRTFPIQKNPNIIGGLEDILVTKSGDIYVLNTAENIVCQYKSDGELAETYDLSGLDLFFPDSLIERNGEVMVSQNQERFASLADLHFLEERELSYQLKRVNRKESVLQLNEEGHHDEYKIFSDLGLGNLAVQQVTEDQIIYMQTVTPPVNTPVSETHVLALNRQGDTLGGVRIPEEKFIVKPQRMERYIQTEGNQIFLMIPEKEYIGVYEVALGTEYDRLIEEQLEKVEIGYDYRTFGKPFPELEAELLQLFRRGEINFGDEDSLNGAAIDEQGTVVVDFKDFMAGSPASAQAQTLFHALHSATFEKFPEIKQIYFQFDGSFSAWAHWLESTEEPWKGMK